MATARAIANGNWSSTSTWNGGVLPGNGDTVYANGFNVTLDTDILIGGANNPTVNAGSFVSGQWYEIIFVGTTSWTGIGAASNTAGTVFLATGAGSGTGTAKAIATLTTTNNTAAGAAAGGSFVMSTVRAINTDLRAGTTTCLNVTATTGTLTLSGIRAVGGGTGAFAVNTIANTELQAGCVFTGATGSALNNAGSGTVTVSGSSTFTGGSTFGAVSAALNNASNGSITVSASSSFTGGTGGSTNSALYNASTGSVNVTAACTFSGSSTSPCFINASTGSVTILASCTFTGGTSSLSSALNNASTGSVTVTNSTFTASAFANAVSIANNSADVRLSGDFLDHWSGWKAVSGGKWRLGTTPTAARTRYALAGTTDSYVEMFTADNTGFGLPAANHVRSGISYGGGAVTGTCAVPAAGSVAFGVPVDNTTGTAILTQANVQSALTAQGLTSARAANLDNLDAAVSSRLAPSGTLATVTNLTNAPASVTPADIWSHATRTITGGTVDTLTNAPTVPSANAIASQVRTELTTELNRIDAAISTRATPANVPTSDITAIKTKTDALNTTRLGQVATTEIVGNLLAQANS